MLLRNNAEPPSTAANMFYIGRNSGEHGSSKTDQGFAEDCLLIAPKHYDLHYSKTGNSAKLYLWFLVFLNST